MKAEEYNGYKMGALKRKFKTGRADVEPGTFISKLNAMKSVPKAEAAQSPSLRKTAFMGMV